MKRNIWQAGDTIIEVLISIMILSLVLAVTFVSTSRSLQQGTDANNRQQATSFAQQQIEIIKNAVALNSSNVTNYEQQPGAFCVAPDGTTQPITVNSNPCQFASQQYNISDSFQSGLFTVNATWTNQQGTNDNLVFYYRVPDTSIYLQPPTVKLTADQTNMPIGGGTTTIRWAVTGSATSCTPSNGDATWRGSSPNPSGGSQLVTVTATTTYTLTCSNVGGASNPPGSVTINVTPPPASAYLCANANPCSASNYASSSSAIITQGQSVTLYWGSLNATSCPSTSPAGWTANTSTSGSATVTPTTIGNNPYTISCSNSGGTAISNTVQVTVNEPPCPSPYTGTEPNCVPPPCPSGYTGTYPNCVQLPPTINYFYVNSAASYSSTTMGIAWSVSGATSCSISNVGGVGAGGSTTVAGGRTYTLTCYNGSVYSQASMVPSQVNIYYDWNYGGNLVVHTNGTEIRGEYNVSSYRLLGQVAVRGGGGQCQSTNSGTSWYGYNQADPDNTGWASWLDDNDAAWNVGTTSCP
jgi:type II secretory pathway pseudopilin PulG